MARFLYFYVTDGGQGHVQSLVVSSVLLTAGMLLFILAVFGDIMRINRKMMQKMLSGGSRLTAYDRLRLKVMMNAGSAEGPGVRQPPNHNSCKKQQRKGSSPVGAGTSGA